MAIHNRRVSFDLQVSLAASSAGYEAVIPHHPITCAGVLELDEEEFRCPHAAVPADEERTIYCIQHSIAFLLIEEAIGKLGP